MRMRIICSKVNKITTNKITIITWTKMVIRRIDPITTFRCSNLYSCQNDWRLQPTMMIDFWRKRLKSRMSLGMTWDLVSRYSISSIRHWLIVIISEKIWLLAWSKMKEKTCWLLESSYNRKGWKLKFSMKS